MKTLFVKPADRFLENEFVFQQLGPNYLQSHLQKNGLESDLMILYEHSDIRKIRNNNPDHKISLDDLKMLYITDGVVKDEIFDKSILGEYDIIGLSVMSPQAPDAYLLSQYINKNNPNVTSVIGGSHPRYYLSSVKNLPEEIAFDFIVPQDGWTPMLELAKGNLVKGKKSQILMDQEKTLQNFSAPTRPVDLMSRYDFKIAGVQAFHAITALGCPFSCNFCESGRENVRSFSKTMINDDLEAIAVSHKKLGRDKYSVMFFDDVGLMNPRQVNELSTYVKDHGFTTWRAFTHAYLVNKFKENLLGPFHQTGGMRIGMGLETGSQKSLDMINKRNGQKQYVSEHYEAVKIANEMGVAVDGFTMIYPWENEDDLKATTEMVKFIVGNEVKGVDEMGRPLKNHVDSTIMTPYEGTKFNEMIAIGQLEGVEMVENMDPGLLFYKGIAGGGGWPYKKTVLSQKRYEEEQDYRNSFRPKYR